MKEINNIITESGKTIDVFDDVFTFAEREDMFQKLSDGMFKVSGTDTSSNQYQVFANYTVQQLEAYGITKFEGFKYLNDRYNLINDPQRLKQIRVNYTNASEKNHAHYDDTRGLTLIYYLNPEWDVKWGGHTIFFNESITGAEFTSLYIPNRAVIFDASIPHMILTPTCMAPMPRFSFVIQTRNPYNYD
jgi:hypothetical protein